MAYAAQAMAPAIAGGASPVPYTVRNTFIDLAPIPGEAIGDDRFSTWPVARQPPAEDNNQELEDGEVPEWNQNVPLRNVHVDIDPGAVFLDPAQPSRPSKASGAAIEEAAAVTGGAGRVTPSEDGELSEDEELSDEKDDNSRPKALLFSLGSNSHKEGKCRPCAWMHKTAAGCRNGANCEYCHLCSPGELKRRKKDKLHRRIVELKQFQEQASSQAASAGLAAEGGSTSPGAELLRVNQASVALMSVLAMEPCYIEVPSLTATDATSSSPSRPPRSVTRLAPTSPNPAEPGQATQSRQSLGSMGHNLGQCKPCAWMHKDAKGCRNGANCTYCHVCPPGELKRRKREKFEVLHTTPPKSAAAAVVAANTPPTANAAAPAATDGVVHERAE